MNESNTKLVTLRRRTFLGALGISGVVSLSGCERLAVQEAVPLLQGNADGAPGESIRYASTCLACPAACGLLVTVRDGRPIKLEGLPEHPLSKGGLCTLAQANVRGLYDAGRLRRPQVDGADSDWATLDKRVAAGLAKTTGALAILTPTLVSPTMRQAVMRLLATYGGRLVEYDAGVEAASGVMEAYRLLDGRALYPSVDLSVAEVWLSIGGDPIATGPAAVMLTRQLADRRRARKGGADFRHIHLEGNLSLCGAGADVRVQANTAERALFAAHLLARVAATSQGGAAELAQRLTAKLPSLAAHEQKLASIADELIAKRGRALVTSASRLPTEQLAVALLNRLLAAEGGTLKPAMPWLIQRGRDGALHALLAAIEAGAVKGVIIIDMNPVEQLPDGDQLAAKLKEMALSVAITSRPSATAEACQLVATAHHELERWSDAMPRAEVMSIAQPSLRPLFQTRDPLESILRWSGDASTALDYLKTRWAVKADAGERVWDETLSRGIAAADVAAARAPQREPLAAADEAAIAAYFGRLSAATEELEVELLEEVGPRDGRNSFNPWLRELPDPLTRNAWTAVARLAPSLAKAKGISDGDDVIIAVGERSLLMQARIMPGQHRHVIGVPLGYGVQDGDAGEMARNGYRLAKLSPAGLQVSGMAATLQRRGKGAALPLMQWASSPHGRPIIHQVGDDEEKIAAGHHPTEVLWGADRKYAPHWHMVIDLDTCTGCSACVIACQAENNLPVVGPQNMIDHRDMFWLRIDRYYVGDDDDPEVLFEPMLCAQCDNAPCETVCPVAATVHSHDGLNMQAYNRCVGTRYCANNCPYKVRRFNWFDFTPKDELERLVLNPDVVVRERGVMEKCTFCVQRIQQARIHDGQPGQAPLQTACQQSCPAQAISFGDRLSDKHIQQQQQQPRAFQVLADLGVLPSITYLARVRRREIDPGSGS